MSSKKSAKNTFANLVALNNSSSKTLVPPVLQEVSKLAAGVASVSTVTGSATGNPRNKCALQPGHSLIDWVRLGASGEDLTGIGSNAGHLSVSLNQLAQHNKITDAWLSIRGRVYNVTRYMPFHPGGQDELMKGAGSDATNLFEQIHPWVNYEQILQKCYIGPLVTTIDANDLFSSIKDEKKKIDDNRGKDKEQIVLPRFDWIQKLDYITIIFYTKPFSNPFIEIEEVNKNTINISLIYDRQNYFNEIIFYNDIKWPCHYIKCNYEIGKVEIGLRKNSSNIWSNYGILKQTNKKEESNFETRINCIITKKLKINHNSFIFEMERTDNVKTVMPIGKHIKIYSEYENTELWRNYTPTPNSIFNKFKPQQQYSTDTICLLVKRYENGKLSKILTDSQIGDTIHISKPLGMFCLEQIEKRETFIIIAAGTGITPMLALILFLLERRIKKCRFLRLLFFNKTSNDILLKIQLEELQQEDQRFTVQHILSEPDETWTGLKGRVTKSMLKENFDAHLKNTGYNLCDVYVTVCGPVDFTNLTHSFLKEIGLTDDQLFFFLA